jgi:hypothetical protein
MGVVDEKEGNIPLINQLRIFTLGLDFGELPLVVFHPIFLPALSR